MTPHDPRVPDHVPAGLVRDFDHVHGPALDFDAFTVYREAPTDRVFYSPFNGGYWVLTKAEDFRAALKAPEIFSSSATGIPAHPSRREKMYPLELDPPEHRPHRQILTPFFAPKAVVAKAQAIRRVCVELLDPLVRVGECEFNTDFAQPFPTTIFTAMLGLPNSESKQFVEWNSVMLHEFDDPARRAEAGVEINVLPARLDRAAGGRSAGRPGVTTTRHQHRRSSGDPGHRTELHVPPVRRGPRHRHCRPGIRVSLPCRESGPSPTASRRTGRHPRGRRRTAASVQLHQHGPHRHTRLDFAGVQMKSGDRLLASTTFASMDPDEFDAPLVVDFRRRANRHLAFGAGPHRCAGSHLAREELRTAITEFHRRIPRYEVVRANEIWMHGGGAMGIDRLDLRWPPTDSGQR